MNTLAAVVGNHGEKASVTGAWSLPKGFVYFLDRGLADGVARLASRRGTLLDVGAGKGLYVRYFRSLGLNASGVEGAANIEKITAGLVAHRELTRPFPRPCAAFDCA